MKQKKLRQISHFQKDNSDKFFLWFHVVVNWNLSIHLISALFSIPKNFKFKKKHKETRVRRIFCPGILHKSYFFSIFPSIFFFFVVIHKIFLPSLHYYIQCNASSFSSFTAAFFLKKKRIYKNVKRESKRKTVDEEEKKRDIAQWKRELLGQTQK